jgi:lipopolysaccharide biosynthesis glycosyltransferase
MLVLQNMDELMDLQLDIAGDSVFAACHACVCNPLKKPHYPKDWYFPPLPNILNFPNPFFRTPSNCGYTSQHTDPESAKETGAPSTFGTGVCNGGLQVVNPSLILYEAILTAIRNPAKTAEYDFADQSLLSDTFFGRWVPLSYKYNALKTLKWCHGEIWRDEDVKNVHYILAPKPWDEKEGESDDETHRWWWRENLKRVESEKALGVADGW